VKALMTEAKRHRVDCICLFTRKPAFFAGQGFSVAQREDLPDKIFKNCHACPRFHSCDEVAMVRGNLPKFAILPERRIGWSNCSRGPLKRRIRRARAELRPN
jgi:amino-acid N-acetyltransferase